MHNPPPFLRSRSTTLRRNRTAHSSPVRRVLAVTAIATLSLTGVLASVLIEARPAWALPFLFDINPPFEGAVFSFAEDGSSTHSFTGQGDPGDTVRLTSIDTGGNPDAVLCTSIVQPAGTWSCVVTSAPNSYGTILAQVIAGDQVGTSDVREFHFINPPTVTSANQPGNGILSNSGTFVNIDGVAYSNGSLPPATVDVTVAGVGGCSVPVLAEFLYSCPIDFTLQPEGVYTYDATFNAGYGTSPQRTGTITIDRSAGFTFMTAPTPGQVVADLTPQISGTGEPGGTAYPLFFPSFASACAPTPINAAGVWSCSLASLAPGEYTVGSYQIDEAGNTGPSPDPQVTFTVVAPPPPPPPVQPNPPSTTDVFTVSVAGADPTPEPTPTPTPIDEPTEDSSEEPEQAAGPTTTPAGGTGGGAARVGGGGPSDPTLFGTSLRTPFDVLSTPAIVLAGAIVGGVSFLLFVAIPAELLHATVRENYHRFPRLRGSWHTRVTAWTDRLQRRLGRTASLVNVIALVAALSTLVDPSAGFTVSTLRLWLAIAISLFVVNVVGGLAMRAAAQRWFGVDIVQRILPGAILLTVATVLLSRLFGIAPGLLFGLVLGTQLARELKRDESGRLAAFVTALLLALGLGAWTLYGASVALGSSEPGFAELLWRETLVAMTVESLTSLVIAIIPITFLDGRAIWQWSKRVWAGLAAITAVAFVTIIVPLPNAWAETAGPLSLSVILFLGFGVLTVVIWGLFRWIAVREERAERDEHSDSLTDEALEPSKTPAKSRLQR